MVQEPLSFVVSFQSYRIPQGPPPSPDPETQKRFQMDKEQPVLSKPRVAGRAGPPHPPGCVRETTGVSFFMCLLNKIIIDGLIHLSHNQNSSQDQGSPILYHQSENYFLSIRKCIHI